MTISLLSVRLRLFGRPCRVPLQPGRKILPGFMMFLRIDRLLDRPHDVEPVAVLDGEIFHLALADAVLAGAGAVHLDGAQVEPADEFLGPLDLAGVCRCRP